MKNNKTLKNKSINSTVISKKKLNKTLKKIKINKVVDIKKNLNIFLPSSNQYNTGRCWIFSFLNILRIPFIKHYKMHPTFYFSPSYLAFWDKYEKCNYFLYLISKYHNDSIDDFNTFFLLNRTISDGGSWNMIQNIINKYGIVPYDAMKETLHSINTKELNILINLKLKLFAKQIRNSKPNSHNKLINKQMKHILQILIKCYGNPPKQFNIEMNNKKYKNIKPTAFFNDFVSKLKGNNLNNKTVFINHPNLKEYTYYTINELNNMNNNNNILYFNVPIKDLKQFCLNSLKDNQCIWFGSDYNKFNIKSESLLDNSIFNYKSIGINKNKLFLNKGNAINYLQTNVNHAMVLTGFFYKNSINKPNFWLIENSHDDKLKTISYENNFGNVIMSDSWFNNHVIMAVIDNKYISSSSIKNKIKDKNNIIVLPKWNNLGELLVF